MCGICGFTGAPDGNAIRKMTDAISHRGPDDDGYWENVDVSFGMRRLAIIDLSTGQQPVFNETGSIGIVFNGEIYNHIELRLQLEAVGYVFQTHHSDTEVIIHLYEEYGDDFLNHLNGMFAIALWDVSQKRLLLARDRAGIKPLYFGFFNNRLLFASEIKSLLAHPLVVRKPNYRALYHYFSLKNIPSPLSAFEGIEQLQPGERVIYTQGKLKREKWWSLQYVEDYLVDEQCAADRIRKLLEDSVRLCMRSDVPIGAYLSGGVDSSSIVALMSRIGGHRVKTFSLVYADDIKHKASDRAFANKVAKMYDTDHHEFMLTPQDVINSFDDVITAFDEPFSGVASTYFITHLISKHAKVALSGDGADEIFGSYLSHRLAQPLAHFPNFRDRLKTLSEMECNLLRPFLDRPKYLADILDLGDEVTRRMSLYLWSDKKKQELLSDKMLELCSGEKTEQLIRNLYLTSGTEDPLNRALNCDFQTLLPDQVLAFVDRLSMSHSVEVRPPFLDHRLMEFAAGLPGSMKIKNGRNKHILKEAVKDLIPTDIVDRPKEGFLMPIDHWLLDEMKNFVQELLAPDRLALHGLFRPEVVKKLICEHYAKSTNHGPRIWNLIMFQRWWECYFVHK
jgi:asparagine synthase (glutamine-hydrolysing)